MCLRIDDEYEMRLQEQKNINIERKMTRTTAFFDRPALVFVFVSGGYFSRYGGKLRGGLEETEMKRYRYTYIRKGRGLSLC